MRDRFNAFVYQHEIAWELSMGFLAIVYVATGFRRSRVWWRVGPAFHARGGSNGHLRGRVRREIRRFA
jgi:hypothetical protein